MRRKFLILIGVVCTLLICSTNNAEEQFGGGQRLVRADTLHVRQVAQFDSTARFLDSGVTPFTVVSSVLVSNLNSDLLDGQTDSYYLDSDNFTGTEWTDLTDSGETTIHIHDGRYYTETELNNGQLDTRYYTETEIDDRVISDLTDVDDTGRSLGDFFRWNGTVWADSTYADSEIDHGGLTGLGDDDHEQYHTDARALTWIGTRSTSDLSEGTNLYWTQARFNTAFGNKSTTDLSEGTNLYWTQARFNTAFTAKSTTDLSEGTNLYYTTARADARIALASIADLATKDHDLLDGLADDDHSQYYNSTRLNAWTGSAEIITVGTIGTGTWQGSSISTTYTDANNYVHPTTAGNKHVPTGGASSQFLQYSASGTAVWSTVAWTEVASKPSTFSPSAHVLNSATHTVSGLTPGQFLKALTATTFGFAAHGLSYGDVGAAPAAGSSSIVTVGTIGTGTWQGTAVADAYIASSGNWNTAYGWGNHAAASYADSTDLKDHLDDTNDPHSVTKAQVGLSNVEDTALSTWAGTTNITTLGTIATGTWTATALAATYVGDLPTSKITSGTFADARISQASVTQHEAALTILETQITDGSVLARIASNETISGKWTFSDSLYYTGSQNAGADVDKFLVLDAGNVVDYRTGAEVLSDIGAGTSNLSLGETSDTAYRGDRGVTAYDHSQASHAPTNADNTAANETSHTDVVVDGDFTSNGYMKRTGAGTYAIQATPIPTSDTAAKCTDPNADETGANTAANAASYTGTSIAVTYTDADVTADNWPKSHDNTYHTTNYAPVASPTFTGSVTIGSVNAGYDTDKFLVLDSNGHIDFRTGAEVRSDIVAGIGTVTSVAAGDGMDFTTITTTGSVTMGTPGGLNASSQNNASTTSHTHAIANGLISGANGVSVTGGRYAIEGTLSIGLGAITPTSVAASGNVTGSNLNISNWNSAYTHIGESGTSHTYINQDLRNTGTPTFAAVTSTGDVTIGDDGFWADGGRAYFGTGNDFYITHTGAQAQITADGAEGNFNIEVTAGGDLGLYGDGIHLNYDGRGDVAFFQSADAGENPKIHLYGDVSGTPRETWFMTDTSGGLNITAYSYITINTGAAGNLTWDFGGTQSWRDRDSGNATRMTLASDTGDLWLDGDLHLDEASGNYQVLYISTGDEVGYLPIGDEDDVLTVVSGIPAWQGVSELEFVQEFLSIIEALQEEISSLRMMIKGEN